MLFRSLADTDGCCRGFFSGLYLFQNQKSSALHLFEIKSPRRESRNQRTSCREILFKAVFCEMVRTPYKRVNVLSFEMYLIILSFRLLENQTY